MFKVSVRSSFAASHELKGYRGDCAALHGHNWGASIVVEVDDVDEVGLGIDFRVLRDHLDKVVLELDHRHLNDLDPFRDINPTAESIARYLFRRVNAQLPEGVRLLEARVDETDEEWASYRE